MKELEKNKPCFSDNLSSTLEKLMTLNKINMHQLHKLTGIPITTINRLVNDKNVNPTVSSLIPLADYFDITLNQLIGIDPLHIEVVIGKVKRNTWTNVPLISWEQAIQWPENISSPIEVISTDSLLEENPFALMVTENNLEGFLPRSIIIVDGVVNPKHSNYVIATKLGQSQASLKQVLIDDGRIYLRPLNKDFQTTMMDETYKINGVVAQIKLNCR